MDNNLASREGGDNAGVSRSGGRPDGPNLTALKTWAEARGLKVVASWGDQREPENVVAVVEEGRSQPLLRRTSLDSTDTAAMYLINVIHRLRLED